MIETRGLGILAGGGLFPVKVAESAVRAGRPVHIVAISGEADATIEAFPHTWIKLGEVGRILKTLKKAECRELVIIGSVTRPDLSQVRFDLGGILNLPTILGLTIGGDDSLLSNVIRFFEARGFEVRGAHEVAPELLAGSGPIGRNRPGDQDIADIAKGWHVVEALGGLDVGQACVVARSHVLAIEAAEGTDRMLGRCGELRQWGAKSFRRRRGVLVKCPKRGQELRVDMPAIGPRTIELVAAAGLSGVAVEASAVLIAERDRVAALADKLGVFVLGVER